KRSIKRSLIERIVDDAIVVDIQTGVPVGAARPVSAALREPREMPANRNNNRFAIPHARERDDVVAMRASGGHRLVFATREQHRHLGSQREQSVRKQELDSWV